MKAIDRVMASYSRTHELTEEQTAVVRKELAEFIDGFVSDRLPLSQSDSKQPAAEIK
jgi:hypothetical protein